MMVLPDLITDDLDVVFCGTAAGTASAVQRAYYAGPGNAFWPTLFAVGMTPVLLEPREFARLSLWNMGFTDLAKTVFGSDSRLEKRHFDTARLRALVLAHRPRYLAFTGKRAAAEFTGGSVQYGLHSQALGATRLFVLPSPSGAARAHWSPEPWQELSRLRSASRLRLDSGR